MEDDYSFLVLSLGKSTELFDYSFRCLSYSLFPVSLNDVANCPSYFNSQRAGARDDKGNPVIRDYYSSPLTARYRLMMVYAA